MRILLTEPAAARAAGAIASVSPAAELVVMAGDGSLSTGPWEDAAVDVAWATYDLYEDGGPARPFFGFLVRTTTARWVQLSNAGVDHPVFADLLRRGLRLTTSHVTDIPIAEYVLRAVLDHYQRPQEWRDAQRDRAWRRHDFREVHGTTWLVVGLGAIGTAVATRARAFGASVVGVRRTPSGREPVDRVVTPDELAGVMAEADVVVLAAPATSETRHLVDASLLAAAKDGSVLVNIARGALVDEDALVDALDRPGGLEAAVLDVTAIEPLPEASALWAHPAVTITPHNAAGGIGRGRRATDLFCENLGRYQRGEPLLHEVTEADLA